MNVATITMDKDEARERYNQYRQAIGEREATDEDRGIMLGYKALASGKALLDLGAVFRACPLDERGRPKLAVGRASWNYAHLTSGRDGSLAFTAERWNRRRGRWYRISFPAGTLQRAPSLTTYAEHRALVPLIPINLRPQFSLSNYLILWEAVWEPVPPIDPLLLRHLHGGLYLILASWDLTPLERAVLSGRLLRENQ